ncbi:MAG: hypothetical protein R6W68_13235 [Ignavibacteriaceae bacterium]
MYRLSIVLFTVVIIFIVFPGTTKAQERPYTEGSVWNISYIQTKDAYFLDYMNNLNNGWKRVMEDAKKEGYILNYMVLSSQPSNRDDWDLMLLVEYKNWAAFDGLMEKMNKVQEKLFGSNENERKESAVARNELREILGSKTALQLNFK